MYKIALADDHYALQLRNTRNPFVTNESNPSLCETATSVVEGEFTVGRQCQRFQLRIVIEELTALRSTNGNHEVT